MNKHQLSHKIKAISHFFTILCSLFLSRMGKRMRPTRLPVVGCAARNPLEVGDPCTMPFKTKMACIRSEIKRITDRCSKEKNQHHENKNFEKLLNTYGHPLNTMITAKRRLLQQITRHKEDSVFFNFTFFNDSTHWKMRKIFKDAELSIKLYNTNTTLNQTPCKWKKALIYCYWRIWKVYDNK